MYFNIEYYIVEALENHLKENYGLDIINDNIVIVKNDIYDIEKIMVKNNLTLNDAVDVALSKIVKREKEIKENKNELL